MLLHLNGRLLDFRSKQTQTIFESGRSGQWLSDLCVEYNCRFSFETIPASNIHYCRYGTCSRFQCSRRPANIQLLSENSVKNFAHGKTWMGAGTICICAIQKIAYINSTLFCIRKFIYVHRTKNLHRPYQHMCDRRRERTVYEHFGAENLCSHRQASHAIRYLWIIQRNPLIFD